jgi:hypothetical protein
MDSDSEERECTEIDEEDLLRRAADGGPVLESGLIFRARAIPIHIHHLRDSRCLSY